MSSKDLESALGALEEVGKKGLGPSHYLARDVLLAMGRWMREADPGSADPLFLRAREVGRALAPGWGEAVRTELSMACAEFFQSVDPRYLGVPDYDLEYTRAARARLGDRMRAAGALGFAPTNEEAELLILADQVWAAHLRRSSSLGPAVSGRPGPAKGSPRLGRRSPNKNRHN